MLASVTVWVSIKWFDDQINKMDIIDDGFDNSKDVLIIIKAQLQVNRMSELYIGMIQVDAFPWLWSSNP